MSMQRLSFFSYFLMHKGSKSFAICCTRKWVVSHPNNTSNFNSVGEKSVILNSLGFGVSRYIYIMGSSQLR